MGLLDIYIEKHNRVHSLNEFEPPYWKIVDENTAIDIVNIVRNKPIQIVALEAVMDLPHYRHADYLLRSRNLGDFLMVRLNTDRLITSRKNQNGPIVEYENRARHLAHYPYVNLITQKDDGGSEWLYQYKPNVVVKSVTSPVAIMEETLSVLIPVYKKLGIRLVVMDQFAQPILLKEYPRLTIEYNADKLGTDKFSGTIIKQRITNR